MGCTTTRSSSLKQIDPVLLQPERSSNIRIVPINPSLRETYVPIRRLSSNYQFITNNMHMTANTEDLIGIESSNINGFVNKSNTCFVASALQCIIRIPPLQDYFLSNHYLKDLKEDKSQNEKEFLNSVAEIFIGYFNVNLSALEIDRFLSQLGWVFPGYEVGQQQDAQEFLVYFFDKLHSIQNRASSSSISEPVGHKLENDIERAWVEYLKKDKSIVVGKLKRHIPGSSCNDANVQRMQIQNVQIRAFNVPIGPHMSIRERADHSRRVSLQILSERGV